MSLDSNAEREAFVAEERAAHKAWLESPVSSDWDPYYAFLEGWHASVRAHQQDSLPVWVACSERMPDPTKGEVLWFQPEAQREHRKDLTLPARMLVDRHRPIASRETTHWMPLPSPPEPLMPKE